MTIIRSTIALSVLLAACSVDPQRDEVPDDFALLTGDALASAQLATDVAVPGEARIWLGPAIEAEEPELDVEVDKVCSYQTKFWAAVSIPHAGFLCLNTCTPITIFIIEEVQCENSCGTPLIFECFSSGNAGHEGHVTTHPGQSPTTTCRTPCNPVSTCEGCN